MNFHDSAQNNVVEQHSEQSWKPSNQQLDFKDWSWKVYIHCEWPAIDFIWAFQTGYTSAHEWYNIDIYVYANYKADNTAIIKSFVTLKELNRMRESDGLRCELYAVPLYRVLWELDTLPPFFCYELLV